ncbi:hypothetical protein NKJ16_24975 [Mesorhizobium sp. M0179]|uniref:hypothetical protein n=1 Tax=unclassified Mesorhizobium TaxID=325217 RepID=UPI0012EC1636|nr:hypothetical protein [Mesorhizobium sp. LSJC265A00]
MTADELMNLSQAYRLICKALKDKAIAERRLLSALAESKIRATAGILRPNYDDGRDADQIECPIDANLWNSAVPTFYLDEVEFTLQRPNSKEVDIINGKLVWRDYQTDDPPSNAIREEGGADNETEFNDGIEQLEDEPTTYTAYDVRLNSNDMFGQFPNARKYETIPHRREAQTVGPKGESLAGGATIGDSKTRRRNPGGRPMMEYWIDAAAYVAAFVVENDQIPTDDMLKDFFDQMDKSPDERQIRRFTAVLRKQLPRFKQRF